MYHVVVREKGTRRELARYSYETKAQAREAQRNVRDVRVKQNHERVTVSVEFGE